MDPFGFSSFVADLKLGIFLSIFSGVGGDLFHAVDLETTLPLPSLFLDDDPLPAPDCFSRFQVMATKEKKRKKKKKEKRKRCKLADEKCFGLVLTRSERNAC
jgi:hypothetical protein